MKNKETREGIRFWKFVEQVSEMVEKWPTWKKAGFDLNIPDDRNEFSKKSRQEKERITAQGGGLFGPQ